MSRMSGNERKAKADLYQFVFGFRPLRLVVAFMFVFFVMHPVMPAFASELGSESAPVEEASAEAPSEAGEVTEPEPEEVPAPELEQLITNDVSEVAENATSLSGEAVALSLTNDETLVSETEIVDEAAEVAEGDTAEPVTEADTEVVGDSNAPNDAEPITDDSIVVDTDTVPSTEDAGNQSSGGGTSADSDETAASPSDEEQATTTVPEAEFYEVVTDVDHTSDLYQFSKQQCVSMGSGAYHCFDASAETFTANTQELRAERDADGDKEIYLTTADGETYKLSDNKVDDDAPYYDTVSDSVVWHRLVDGRYQIISYQDERETVLSGDFQNSMEPNRSGTYTAWQSWVHDTWQVVLFDGETAKVISNSPGQHIAPQVEGDYVIWNVTNGTSHQVAVYEIATGLVSMIDDEEGARVSNPRFVLVYDTRFDNGDVITKGYDAETGSVVPLSAAAPVVPEELPSSDQTGEVRALLQNKSTSREDSIENGETGETTASSTDAVATTASTSAPSLVAASTTDATLTVPATSTIPNLPLTDFDIVVTPYSTTTSSQ